MARFRPKTFQKLIKIDQEMVDFHCEFLRNVGVYFMMIHKQESKLLQFILLLSSTKNGIRMKFGESVLQSKTRCRWSEKRDRGRERGRVRKRKRTSETTYSMLLACISEHLRICIDFQRVLNVYAG